MEVIIKGKEITIDSGERTKNERERNDWSQERIEYFRENLGNWTSKEKETEELWKQISDKMKGGEKKENKNKIYERETGMTENERRKGS